MDYIYINSVKHGLVYQFGAWPYSTFHRDVKRGRYAPDWAGVSGGHALSAGEPA